jgi:hypothetical protein
MVVRVVTEQHVDPIKRKLLEALLERDHDAVVAEVPRYGRVDGCPLERFAFVVLALIPRGVGAKEASHLGGHDRVRAFDLPELLTHRPAAACAMVASC